MIRSPGALAPCALLGGLALSSAWAAPPFRYPERRYGDAWLRYINGIPVLAVAGTPEQIGRAAGVLALRPGRRMAGYPDDLLRAFHLRPLRDPLLLGGWHLLRRFPADYRAELQAMYAAAGLDLDLAVLNNTFYDLKKIVLCSALLVEGQRSSTGGPLLGRNLEYPLLGYAHQYSLVTLCRPHRARHAFASVGFPGMVGCLSGMNDAGLAVAVLEVYQVRLGQRSFDLSGMPFALCFRRLLEECSSIEEALPLLKTMRRTGLNNLVVADRAGVAVFEITPERVVVRRSRGGTCVCTNHFCSPELQPLVRINLFDSNEHFQTLEKVAGLQRQLGAAEVQLGLHAVCDPEMTMQTMVFEPQRLRLHLAIGAVPASAGTMRLLELGRLLQHP
jgi:hypothetical protein